jgi:hypothetical protein
MVPAAHDFVTAVIDVAFVPKVARREAPSGGRRLHTKMSGLCCCRVDLDVVAVRDRDAR